MLVHIKTNYIFRCSVLCTAMFDMEVSDMNCFSGCTTVNNGIYVHDLPCYFVSTSVASHLVSLYQGLTRRGLIKRDLTDTRSLISFTQGL